jgi:hypothetical protein
VRARLRRARRARRGAVACARPPRVAPPPALSILAPSAPFLLIGVPSSPLPCFLPAPISGWKRGATAVAATAGSGGGTPPSQIWPEEGRAVAASALATVADTDAEGQCPRRFLPPPILYPSDLVGGGCLQGSKRPEFFTVNNESKLS